MPPTTPKDVKLRIVKSIINASADMIYRAVPEVEPTIDACIAMQDIVGILIDVTKSDTTLVPFDDNIEKLLKAIEKTVIYIAETDPAYGQLLSAAYGLVMARALVPRDP